MYFKFHKDTKDIRKQPVSKIMKKRTLETVRKDLPIVKLLRMFFKHEVKSFPVIDKKGKLIGDVDVNDLLPFAINPVHLSEHEIIGALGTNIHEIYGDCVEDIMNRHEEKITPDFTIEEAAFVLWKNKIHCLPVVKDEKLIGVVSEEDILNILIKRIKKKTKTKTRKKKEIKAR